MDGFRAPGSARQSRDLKNSYYFPSPPFQDERVILLACTCLRKGQNGVFFLVFYFVAGKRGLTINEKCQMFSSDKTWMRMTMEAFVW